MIIRGIKSWEWKKAKRLLASLVRINCDLFYQRVEVARTEFIRLPKCYGKIKVGGIEIFGGFRLNDFPWQFPDIRIRVSYTPNFYE